MTISSDIGSCSRVSLSSIILLFDDPVNLVVFLDLEVFGDISILLSEEVPCSDAAFNWAY